MSTLCLASYSYLVSTILNVYSTAVLTLSLYLRYGTFAPSRHVLLLLLLATVGLDVSLVLSIAGDVYMFYLAVENLLAIIFLFQEFKDRLNIEIGGRRRLILEEELKDVSLRSEFATLERMGINVELLGDASYITERVASALLHLIAELRNYGANPNKLTINAFIDIKATIYAPDGSRLMQIQFLPGQITVVWNDKKLPRSVLDNIANILSSLFGTEVKLQKMS
ncbi:MAG: hypothetical protein GXO26_02835 [Crenarchaeota archaeon]|nr:hypothetical protein [Thermoproteota archaeon]